MLANLMPPLAILSEPIIVDHSEPQTGGFLVVHPRYRGWLARCGFSTPTAILDLPGEIVSGHPDRHVVRVSIRSGTGSRTVYLKREHHTGLRIRWKNARAGFGWVSRSEREGKTLETLEKRGLAAPQWIAYGADARGRSFVLVDELAGSIELRDMLADGDLQSGDRRQIAMRLGRAIAEIHEAGFATPDLSAKHAFVRKGTFAPTIIDWPSAIPRAKIEPYDRLKSLALLSATVANTLASPRDRLRFLHSYLRAINVTQPVRFSMYAKTILAEVRAMQHRPSVVDQRQPRRTGREQKLVWLAGEEVCAVPEIAAIWPTPAVCGPFYPMVREAVHDGQSIAIRLPESRSCTLVRFRSTNPLARIAAKIRGRSWRSHAAKLARMLFTLERLGVEVPSLLAFGQRMPSALRSESFLVYDLPDTAPTLGEWLNRYQTTDHERRRIAFQLGALIRTIHEANCEVGGSPAAFKVIQTGRERRLVVDPIMGVRRIRKSDPSRCANDLAIILAAIHPRLSKADAMRIVKGYGVGDTKNALAARDFTARVFRRVYGR